MHKITGRTVIIVHDIFFSMEEVDKEGGEQENEKEEYIEKLYLFCAHVEDTIAEDNI